MKETTFYNLYLVECNDPYEAFFEYFQVGLALEIPTDQKNIYENKTLYKTLDFKLTDWITETEANKVLDEFKAKYKATENEYLQPLP